MLFGKVVTQFRKKLIADIRRRVGHRIGRERSRDAEGLSRAQGEQQVCDPVARWELVMAKLMATLLFAVIALTETTLGFAVLVAVSLLTRKPAPALTA